MTTPTFKVKTTPIGLANRVARYIRKREGLRRDDPYVPVVRNKGEAKAHGYMRNALATVTYESSSIDLVDITGMALFEDDEFYLEAYSSYMVGVYRK